MSYDLMVFDPAAAPMNRQEFLSWFDQQAEWSETHGYDDPAVSSPGLRSWFLEMISDFPALNGPYASKSDDMDDPRITDYCIGQSVIYAAFRWSEADIAYEVMFRNAAKHRVGFYDVSSDNGAVWVPNAQGEFEMAHSD